MQFIIFFLLNFYYLSFSSAIFFHVWFSRLVPREMSFASIIFYIYFEGTISRNELCFSRLQNVRSYCPLSTCMQPGLLHFTPSGPDRTSVCVCVCVYVLPHIAPSYTGAPWHSCKNFLGTNSEFIVMVIVHKNNFLNCVPVPLIKSVCVAPGWLQRHAANT